MKIIKMIPLNNIYNCTIVSDFLKMNDIMDGSKYAIRKIKDNHKSM